MSGSPLRLGIDLGTTHTVVAVLDEGSPRVLPTAGGGFLLPSVVAFDDDGHLLVGRAARDVSIREPARSAARFKTDMGDDREWSLAGGEYTASMLSALVLREAMAWASTHHPKAVGGVVISVPAWFREPQRAATLDAARLAGLEDVSLVNEPTAAAIAYGLHRSDAERLTAVLDLGGGTFDVTILELFSGMIEVVACAGDSRLGGEDATDALTSWVAEQAGVHLPNLTGRERSVLRHRCDVAKRALASSQVAHVPVHDLPGVEDTPIEVSTSVLAMVLEPLVRRMRTCIADALRTGSLLPSAVQEVLLVGGASRMMSVRQLAIDVFGREPLTGFHPDHVVALGAAVQAGLRARDESVGDLVVTDVLTHSLGVGTQKTWDGIAFPDQFDPVLHRGTTLPCSRTERYHTLRHDQTQVTFPIYEGEHREIAHNTKLGKLTVSGLAAHEDQDARTHLEVRFTHNASGLLEVEATVLGESSAPVSVVLQRGGAHLEGGDLERAIERLKVLKSHPRDYLPNRVTLERARRVFCMVTGPQRATIDELIGALEAALERQDGPVAAERRVVLERFVARVVSDLGLDGRDFDA